MPALRLWLLANCFLILVVSSARAEAPTPHWIALEKDATAASQFHCVLKVPADVELDYADLLVAASEHAVVSINGQRAGEVRGHERFAHFAVKKLLRAGDNDVLVQLTSVKRPHALLLSLHAVDRAGHSHWLVSNDQWRAVAQKPEPDDRKPDTWPVAVSLGVVGTAPWGTPTTEVEHYHQWKQALNAETAVDPRSITVPEGYAIELLRSASKDDGSWISLAFDHQGRLVVGREDKGLLRMTLPKMPEGALAGEAAAKAIQVETINDTLLECRGLLFVGKDLYANANNSKGLYRLRDTDGDDTLDEVKLLREMPGDVGHGRNDLTLGPDGKLYLILGNDVRYPADAAATSPFRNFAQDRLLPCEWNKFLFNSGTPAPGGYVVRTDLEAKSWEVVAGGFRNAYGIAFNDDGEMFTYDADMEWDAGAPWYRPTRINHIVSGGDYGWRQGTDKWRAWYPDGLPSTLDIGLGSPTAVKFGAQGDLAPTHRQALFALDWAFGRIIAVHLDGTGASYQATQEAFISGRPLNVCDLEFGPDGAAYFVTGGRRTQSGIYRVVWKGDADLPREAKFGTRGRLGKAQQARDLRRQLESFHGREEPQAIEFAWPHLGSSDPWLRNAARTAIEAQAVQLWRDKALSEAKIEVAVHALLALTRVGEASDGPAVRKRLCELNSSSIPLDHRLSILRAVQLSLIRQAKPSPAEIATLLKTWEPAYPQQSVELNDLLCELLVYLESPKIIQRTIPLIDAAATPEEKLHYLMCLRLVKTPWTLEQRKAYFTWLQRAEKFPGAHYMPRFIAFIRQDAVATLSESEKGALGDLLESVASQDASDTAAPRPFVKAWTLADFATELDRPRSNADLARGKAMFVAADCAKCHRIAGEGALVGPDLTGVGKRFSKKDLLLSLLEPSRVIDDKYKQKTITTTAGVSYTGQQVAEDDQGVTLITDPTQPTKATIIPRGDIEEIVPSPLSPMPVSLINTLTKEEVLALLEFLAASGH